MRKQINKQKTNTTKKKKNTHTQQHKYAVHKTISTPISHNGLLLADHLTLWWWVLSSLSPVPWTISTCKPIINCSGHFWGWGGVIHCREILFPCWKVTKQSYDSVNNAWGDFLSGKLLANISTSWRFGLGKRVLFTLFWWYTKWLGNNYVILSYCMPLEKCQYPIKYKELNKWWENLTLIQFQVHV